MLSQHRSLIRLNYNNNYGLRISDICCAVDRWCRVSNYSSSREVCCIVGFSCRWSAWRQSSACRAWPAPLSSVCRSTRPALPAGPFQLSSSFSHTSPSPSHSRSSYWPSSGQFLVRMCLNNLSHSDRSSWFCQLRAAKSFRCHLKLYVQKFLHMFVSFSPWLQLCDFLMIDVMLPTQKLYSTFISSYVVSIMCSMYWNAEFWRQCLWFWLWKNVDFVS